MNTKTKKAKTEQNSLQPKPAQKLSKKQRIEYNLEQLEKLSGIGQGVWGEDAQEYVNKLRDNDRR